MSFVEKLAAVRSELVLPPKEEMAAPVAMDAAMTLMGIVAEETWAPCLPPEGYRLVVQPPPAEALEVKNDTQEILVGMSLLYCWPSVGWCVGVIKEANKDRRYKMQEGVVNFWVHYEIDGDTARHVLTLDTYGGDGVGSWVLLEEIE